VKEFDAESLGKCDGKDGNPVHIAYQGKVFDVSDSALWQGGTHMNRHQAGRDLSIDFEAAPHGEEVFERYPQVGVLRESKKPQKPAPTFLSSLIERFPILERHPHPMSVHFPIVFLLSVPFFSILYLITGERSFETTALHCLVGGIVFMPVGMATGLLTWWLNYMAKTMRPVMLKITLSCLLLIASACLLFWKIAEPGVLDSQGMAKTVYLSITIFLALIVSIIGWLGGGLTFPVQKK
jgi:predicted heme/steroid binding protein/uncharacterized membrane protein